MLKHVLAVLALFPLVSCASIGGSSIPRGSLGQLARAPLFTHLQVEEVERLQPQLPRPFRLGIAPPFARETAALTRSRFFHHASDAPTIQAGQWTLAEQALLDDYGQRLRDAGHVSEVVRIPRALVADGESDASLLERIRVAAARMHVDAVLVVHRASNAYSTANALALLDITIIGAAVVPAYKVHSQTALEGLVVDTRNEYLYMSGDGYAESAERTAAYYLHQRARELVEETELLALQNLAEDLVGSLAQPRPAG